jgi:uncharacterized HhH-GPD family protein
MARRKLHLTGEPEADALLTKDPLALLIGMVLDQQVPLEWAFKSPLELERRLGTSLDAASIAAMDPDALSAVFSEKPALHRYPGSMATRVHALCQEVVEQYGGDAAAVWKGAADGAELRRRVEALPGFGPQKARIFVALLGKQLGVEPTGWRDASSPYGEQGSYYSVADIVDAASLDQVRAHKQQMKAAAKAKGAKKAGGAKKAPAAAGARRR